MTDKAKQLLAALDHFTGSYNWYRHGFNRAVTFTDGVKYVADNAGAYWLLDEIVIAQKANSRVAKEAFQVWKLTVNNTVGTLTCEDGNDNVVFSKRIPFTDFPLDEFSIWFENSVIYLPSER